MEFREEIIAYVENFTRISDGKSASIENIAKGTTVLALRYGNGTGTVIAGDCRICLGPAMIGAENFEKLFRVDSDNVIAIAGAVAPALRMIRFLNARIASYNNTKLNKLSFEGKANILSQILAAFFPLAERGLGVTPIFASRDKIYIYDFLGGKFEVKYFALGSGCPHALTHLDDHWRENLTRDQAIKIATKALGGSAKRNNQTGPIKIAYVIEANITKLDLLGGDENE